MITPIIGAILGIANKFIPDEDAKLEFKKKLLDHEKELEQVFNDYSKRDHELRIKEMEFSGFKSLWRPVMMFSFSAIVVLYSFIYYILPGILVHFPSLEYATLLDAPVVDPALWDLVKYSILGIGGMRTVDKWRSK